MKMENELLNAVCVNADAAADFRRRAATGKLRVEAFGCALRIAGPGVDLLVARHSAVTAADLEPITRCR